ncbi:MAG: type II toxin-antitoxin system RelE/ParE family toxin [Rhizobium sp.]|nr:type II toxin-antitoxin system RelE/ParE family toxin [Rhizobium sp.]
MGGFRLSQRARLDIADILAYSENFFGSDGRLRYQRLIATSLRDLADEPERRGSMVHPELGIGVRTYHLRFSRDNAVSEFGLVRRPRHFILYRPAATKSIEVGRLLHDAMDLGRHLSNAFDD